jgi:hypothetical protein
VGECLKCGRIIPAEWGSNNIETLLDDFARAIVSDVEDAETWDAFRRMAIAREAAGRDHFGYRFLDRDNALDGLEEAVDGANYALFDVIKARKTGEHIDESLALTAVYHAWKLFIALAHMRAKRTGAA